MNPVEYSENKIKAITLSGLIIPQNNFLTEDGRPDFKLVCPSGNEYLVLTDSVWRDVLANYSWEEVKIIGLLNMSDKTLIPQKVFLKDPNGDKERLSDVEGAKNRNLGKKFLKNISELVFIPAAVFALMM